MNDRDIEQGLERLLGRAPTVAAPASVRRALQDEIEGRSLPQAISSHRSFDRGFLRSRQGRVVAVLAGMAATVALGASLVMAAGSNGPAVAGSGSTPSATVRLDAHGTPIVDFGPSASPAPRNPDGSGSPLPATPAPGATNTTAPMMPSASPAPTGAPLQAAPYRDVAFAQQKLFPKSTIDALASRNDGVFVFVTTSSGPNVWFSADGRTWSLYAGTSAFGADASIRSAAVASDGTLIATGCAGQKAQEGRIWTSKDGRTWHKNAFATSSIESVAVAGSTAVAFGAESITSTDNGATWTEAAAGSNPDFRSPPMDVKAWKGQFVAIANDASYTQRVWTSTDGVSWHTVGQPIEKSYHHLAVRGDTLVMTSHAGVGDPSIIAYSSDGVTWQSRALDSRGVMALAAGTSNAPVVAIGVGGSGARRMPVYVSSDGTNWREVPSAGLPNDELGYQAAVVGNRIVVVGGMNGDAAIWSGDLIAK